MIEGYWGLIMFIGGLVCGFIFAWIERGESDASTK